MTLPLFFFHCSRAHGSFQFPPFQFPINHTLTYHRFLKLFCFLVFICIFFSRSRVGTEVFWLSFTRHISDCCLLRENEKKNETLAPSCGSYRLIGQSRDDFGEQNSNYIYLDFVLIRSRSESHAGIYDSRNNTRHADKAERTKSTEARENGLSSRFI